MTLSIINVLNPSTKITRGTLASQSIFLPEKKKCIFDRDPKHCANGIKRLSLSSVTSVEHHDAHKWYEFKYTSVAC